MSDPFAAYVAPARPRNQIWRLVLGVIIIGFFWVLGTFSVLFGAQAVLPPEALGAALAGVETGSTPLGMSLLFLTFLGLLIGSIAAAGLMHRRGLQSLTGPYRAFFGDFARVILPLLAFYGGLVALWNLTFDPIPNLAFGQWLVLIPLGLAGVAIQTLAEEMAFRGYFMQQLAARFRSPLVWMGLPTIAFGALHFTGQAGLAVGVLIVLATAAFGLAAADLTRRRGNLGAAWGLHFLNNCFAILILATGGTLPGLALWVTPYGMDTPDILMVMLVADMVALFIAWRMAVWALAR